MIIPCFRPRPGWEDELLAGLKELISAESGLRLKTVILVNDGNPIELFVTGQQKLSDQGFEMMRVDHQINLGKGAAVRSGAKVSTAPYLIYTDMDIPYKNEGILKMAKAVMNDQCDIAIAQRGESYYSSLSAFRRILSRSFLTINKTLFRLSEGDTQGGLKVLNAAGKEALLSTRIDRYLFDLEMVQIATTRKIRIQGFEVNLKDGISLPGFNLRVLLQELGNFSRLLFNRG